MIKRSTDIAAILRALATTTQQTDHPDLAYGHLRAWLADFHYTPRVLRGMAKAIEDEAFRSAKGEKE